MTTFTPNPGQAQAIAAPAAKPVRVVAGAGTGKTEVIARRFVHLLAQHRDWRPENILVLTFSEKAAAEMRARIFQAVTQAQLGFERLDMAAAFIGTFHSFGARLLNDYSLRAGIDPELPLLSELDTQAQLEQAQEEFLETGYQMVYGNFDPLAVDGYDWEDGGPMEVAVKLLGQVRNQAISADEFQRQVVDINPPSDQHRVLAPLTGWVYRTYARALEEQGQLDFDRQINGVITLLESDPALQADVRKRYHALLVDEYQDTNHAQERLLAALAPVGLNGVTVVGDPRQAIYVWREARVENIAGFAGSAADRCEAPLTENRRSLRPILDVANRAIAGYEAGTPPEFDPADLLYPHSDHEHFEGTVVNLQAAPTREAEATAIVGWIRQARAAGYANRDIALLLRARTYLTTYTDALMAAGIPFELSAGEAFYLRPEILDAVHLVNVCCNPAAELSLARVLLGPAVGLTQAQLAELKRLARGRLWPVVTGEEVVEVGAEISSCLSRFQSWQAEAGRQRSLLTPAAFVAWIIHRCGLDAVADPVGERALSKLMAVAQTYATDHPAALLPELAGYLLQLVENLSREKAPELNVDSDAVWVLTAHASKGLEFPVVISADCRQKVRPHRDWSPFHESGVGLVFPEEGTHEPPEFVERMRRARNEARCLWYVTLTRAKRRLILTATNDKELVNGQYARAETFFEDLWNKQVTDPIRGVVLGQAPPAIGQGAATSIAPASSAPTRVSVDQLRHRLAEPRREFSFSPSAFRRFEDCPASYRYYSLTSLGWLASEETVDGDEEMRSQGAAMGSVFHSAVASHARLPGATASDLLAAVLPDLLSTLASEQLDRIHGWLERYLVSQIGKAPPRLEAVERRLSLTFEFGNVRLNMSGVADRLEPQQLIDYKTDADASHLVERYGDQLRLYALAARQAGLLALASQLALYHAPTGVMVDVPFDLADDERLSAKLLALAQFLGLDGSNALAIPGEHCRWCAARASVCEVGRNWWGDHEGAATTTQ